MAKNLTDKVYLICPPFSWWLNFSTGSALCLLMIGILLYFLKIESYIMVFFSFCCFIIFFYQLISLPKKIIVGSSIVKIIWPWKTLYISRNLVYSMRVKKFRINSVFIIIKLWKSRMFCNIIPIRFDWNSQSPNYHVLLNKIDNTYEIEPKFFRDVQ
jgi:hypothetical protein